MRFFILINIFLILSIMLGCDGASEDPPVEDIQPIKDDSTDSTDSNDEDKDDSSSISKPAERYDNEGELFISGVDSVLNEITEYSSSSPDCANGFENDELNSHRCEITTYKLSQVLDLSEDWEKKATNVSEGQRVLIIDSGMNESAVRYPNRVLGMLEWNMTGWSGNQPNLTLQNTHAEVTLRQGLFEIKHKILGKSSSFVPNSEITRRLEHDIVERFTDIGSSSRFHGDLSLNFLADYNPYAQFVLLDVIKFDDKEILCGDGEKASNYMSKVANAIDEIVHEYKVSYVHLSSGMTTEFFLGKIESTCNGSDSLNKKSHANYLHSLYEKMLRKISSDNTLLFQSALNSSNTFITKENGIEGDEYYSDCVNIDNRIRSGYVTKNDAVVTFHKEGLTFDEGEVYLDGDQKQISGCVDLYFNTGWEENFLDMPSFGFSPSLFSANGLGSGPINFMSTSFVNPIALSFINFLSSNELKSAKEVVNYYSERKAANSELPTIFSPMRNKQYMLCMLFPDACDGWDTFSFSAE